MQKVGSVTHTNSYWYVAVRLRATAVKGFNAARGGALSLLLRALSAGAPAPGQPSGEWGSRRSSCAPPAAEESRAGARAADPARGAPPPTPAPGHAAPSRAAPRDRALGHSRRRAHHKEGWSRSTRARAPGSAPPRA